MANDNPYRWDSHYPGVLLPREDLVSRVVEIATRGAGAYVLGGHGMGKSVFMHQVAKRLNRTNDFRAIVVKPQPGLTNAELVQSIATDLGVARTVAGTSDLVDSFLELESGISLLALLFDEIDQYVAEPDRARILFNSLEACRRDRPNSDLTIIAAGGVGTLVLRDHLGSDFLSRATKILLPPFIDLDDLRDLAEPFQTRGDPLSEDVIETIRVIAGGNPALTCFALQGLWTEEDPSSRRVAELFSEFMSEHSEFIASFERSILNEKMSRVPALVLRAVEDNPGSISHESLRRLASDEGTTRIDGRDALELLAAAGLVVIQGRLATDPVAAWPVQTLLGVPQHVRPTMDSLQSTLRDSLLRALLRIHRLSPDFFQRKGQIVPESVISAVLSIQLEIDGWTVDREPVQGAGFTDIKARHPRFPSELAVVEVKIWPRNDYKEIHAQILSYVTSEVTAAACVMVGGGNVGWPSSYQSECLSGVAHETLDGLPPPLLGFVAESEHIDHIMLTLARR